MRVDHLGLIAASVLTLPSALFAGSAPPATTVISAASFNGVVTPTPTVDRRGRNNRLEWTAVTISSGAEVKYVVLRYRDGTVEATCQASDGPIVTNGVASCTDRRSNYDDEYSVTAYVVDVEGASTWSLPESSRVGP